MGNAEKHAMYMRTLRQLIWWCILIAIICTAFLLLLMAVPNWIDPTYSLGQVRLTFAAEQVWCIDTGPQCSSDICTAYAWLFTCLLNCFSSVVMQASASYVQSP